MSQVEHSGPAPGQPAVREPRSVRQRFLTGVMEMFGMSRTVTISALVFAGVVLGGAVVVFVKSAPPGAITITSGPENSIFHTNAVRYAAILARYGIRLNVLTSQGSLENLGRLDGSAPVADVGFVLSGVTNAAIDKLVSLGSVSWQPLLIFYRGATLELLSGLAGKRIAVGAMGSGTRSLALALLGANGIKPGGATTLLDWEPQKSAAALLDGSVDAAFLMGEDAPVALIRKLVQSPDVHLLSLRQAPAYVRRFTYLSTLDLPEGTLDLGRDIPPQGVHLLAPTVELVARKSLHPALSDLLLEAAREVHGRATLFQRKGEFPAPLEHDFPLSPDAARFYKSGKGFFYRFLPFWLASLTSRMLVVFVPTLVVLIPILRSIPVVYRWRMRTRLYRWYRALVAVERQLFYVPEPAERDRLFKRLDEIENAVNKMKLPASFAADFYRLRGHIGFVRQLMSTRR